LFAVTDTAPSNPIVRYQYANGAWAAPTQVAGGFLDAALASDGTRLFAINASQVVPVDPVTLAPGTAVAAPGLVANSALKNVVVGFDNRVLMTTSLTTSGSTAAYLYDPSSGQIGTLSGAINNGTPAMAENGGGAVIVQGDPTLTSDVPIYQYTTSTNTLLANGQVTRQNAVPPTIDRTFSRFVLNGRRVYDGAFAFLGTLPDTTTAAVLRPNGTRTYAYDATAGGILVYDTSATRDGAAYTALGAVTPLPADPGTGVRMAITPDGGTLFIAGSLRIVVMPTPAG
jgi:hypothetical protein